MGKVSKKSLNDLIKAKSIGYENLFLNDLNYHIENFEKNTRQPSQTYKPSNMHCIRSMFYQVVGEPSECRSSSCLIGIGHSGTDRHLRLQKSIINLCKKDKKYTWVDIPEYITKNKLNLDVIKIENFEVKLFNPELNMSFMCDGVLEIEGKPYILEIKTETLFKFQNRRGVAEEHKNQAICYSIAFGINNVLFLYENRDNCTKKTFNFNVKHTDRELITDKIKRCNDFIDRSMLPSKEDGKHCNYCNYSERCKKDGG